jgi:hypothetical protein
MTTVGYGDIFPVTGQLLHCKDTVPEKSKQIFPEMKMRGLDLNSYIHISVSDLYIPTISPPILLQQNRWTGHGNYINRSQIYECGN